MCGPGGTVSPSPPFCLGFRVPAPGGGLCPLGGAAASFARTAAASACLASAVRFAAAAVNATSGGALLLAPGNPAWLPPCASSWAVSESMTAACRAAAARPSVHSHSSSSDATRPTPARQARNRRLRMRRSLSAAFLSSAMRCRRSLISRFISCVLSSNSLSALVTARTSAALWALSCRSRADRVEEERSSPPQREKNIVATV
mmetsp:Transcript_4370/g.12257  ORF Transcript_4370/g.12257 Transcript_4370/m.12257 type:complete len:203 (-) Transcript_4370:930-1538(-)